MDKAVQTLQRLGGRLAAHIDSIPMKRMAVYAGVLLALSLVPLLALGRYNVMCVDDYDYGRVVHDTWLATGSVWQSVRTAWQQNMEFYRDWQGTYISCFLMALCPMNFCYEAAWVVPVIMIGMLATSTFVLGRHILRRWLGADKTSSSFVMFIVLFMFYQVIEEPYEGIYWYNGSTHYVLMESVWFFTLAAISASLWTQKKSRETVLCLTAVILSVIVGGGNLVTGLQAEILMAFLLLYTAVVNRKKIIPAALPLITGTIGFLFNTLAPGNIQRGEMDMDVGYSAVMSVLLSFYHAVVFIIRWTPAFVILVWLMLLPVLWKIMKRSDRTFDHPVWVTTGAFCVLSAMFTPTLFAIGMVGLARVDNIIQMVYYLCLFLVTAYWMGYFSHRGLIGCTCMDTAVYTEERLERKRPGDKANLNDIDCYETNDIESRTAAAEDVEGTESMRDEKDTGVSDGSGSSERTRRGAGEALGVFLEKTGVMMTAVCLLFVLVTWVLTADKNTYTSISALRSLYNGEAKTFYAEAMERHEIYTDPNIVDVEIRPYSVRPALFDFNDLTEDAGNWLNLAVMSYYNKAYVKIVEDTE